MKKMYDLGKPIDPRPKEIKRVFVKVTKVIDNPNGSATVEFEYNSEFKKMVKEHYNRKKFTQKLMEKFVHQVIVDTVNYYKNRKGE